MKTLVIVSHPDILESSSQQYFLHSVQQHEQVTIHHLERSYPNGIIDVTHEQKLLLAHDRIIFQFPFYWYSSPALLKQWQDDVLTDGFAYGHNGSKLAGKEFGLVLMIGIRESEYQAGGNELYSISELTKPFQATAHKLGMIYLKPLSIFQFSYLTEDKKMQLLIQYQQMLTKEKDDSLEAREKWIIEQLQRFNLESLPEDDRKALKDAVSVINNNRDTINELKLILDQMY